MRSLRPNGSDCASTVSTGLITRTARLRASAISASDSTAVGSEMRPMNKSSPSHRQSARARTVHTDPAYFTRSTVDFTTRPDSRPNSIEGPQPGMAGAFASAFVNTAFGNAARRDP
ncbi:Uncharacterised protein [Mycobacteroides abscessus subsp. abscessus]|nr:Uncharacterised protein [Mycobacteroides abscessus subsp. abscessus]